MREEKIYNYYLRLIDHQKNHEEYVVHPFKQKGVIHLTPRNRRLLELLMIWRLGTPSFFLFFLDLNDGYKEEEVYMINIASNPNIDGKIIRLLMDYPSVSRREILTNLSHNPRVTADVMECIKKELVPLVHGVRR